MNQCIFAGNLTADPELRKIPNSDSVVCSFTIAVNNRIKNKGSGEWEDDPCYIDCEAWGQTATLISEHFKKGRPIQVRAEVKQERWNDKETGQKRSRYRYRVDRFWWPQTSKDDRKPDNQEAPEAAPAGGQTGSDIPF